jgi:hypothetical protein
MQNKRNRTIILNWVKSIQDYPNYQLKWMKQDEFHQLFLDTCIDGDEVSIVSFFRLINKLIIERNDIKIWKEILSVSRK